MLNGFLDSIRQIGVFMICAQALIHFKPRGNYEKYLKLLVSAMILVQLLSPIAALLTGTSGEGLEERIAAYSASFEQGMGEGALEEYRIEQLRQKLLTDQIEQLDIADISGTEADVTRTGTEVTKENNLQTNTEATKENDLQTGTEVTQEEISTSTKEVTGELDIQEIRIDPVNINESCR